MSEQRTIVLLNTETQVEVRVVKALVGLPIQDLSNVKQEDVATAVLEAAAEQARQDYELEHGGHYLVINILRGIDG